MRRLKRTLLGVCVLFAILSLVIYGTPVDQWYASRLAGNWTDSDGDILIVLAAEAGPGNVIGLSSYWRATYAILAWRIGHFRSIVVSGGRAEGVAEPLAQMIGRFLAANGIPQDRIFLESRSVSTRENALYTKQMIGAWPGKKVLLTSDYHMFRARRAFEAAGLPVIPRPTPDVIKLAEHPLYRGLCFWTLALESVKIAGYRWRGWIRT
jgi:uncharacterized SAM-binding protein YcdF (DUF218 family)